MIVQSNAFDILANVENNGEVETMTEQLNRDVASISNTSDTGHGEIMK